MTPTKGLSTRILHQSVSELVLSETAGVCAADTSIQDVLKILVERKIGSIVIVENKKPIGIFTERDFLMKVGPFIHTDELDLRYERVDTYMTPNPVCVKMNSPLGKVLLAMRMGKFRHVVVTDDEGQVINVISIRDVMTHLMDEIHEVGSP